MTDPLGDLEDLLNAAVIEHGNTIRDKKTIRTRKDWDANYRASFRQPENWILKSQVELIHVEDNIRTLMGLFDELLHVSVPRCRRLVAASTKREGFLFKIEEVTGEHWLPARAWAIRHQPTHRKVQIVLNLELDMGQSLTAEAVLCTAWLVNGGLQRLCLDQDALFEGNVPRTILALPKGLDILEGLSKECKMETWEVLNGTS
jgi:hypothetical protein